MNSTYTEKYMDAVFYIWYENDRIGIQRLHTIIPLEDGKKPAISTLTGWYRDYGWEQRADAIAGEESEAIKKNVINRRVKMFEKLERSANKLVDKGELYFETHEITSDAAAIRAITDGAELLRASVGQAEAWMKISQMTPTQLDSAFRALLNKGQNEVEIVDADPEPLEDNEP